MVRACCLALSLAALAAEPAPEWKVSVTVEAGPDRGQNPGTLFELLDSDGRAVAGAGFAAAYNTRPRSDRELLQVFARGPGAARAWDVERLPAVDSPYRGFYPFHFAGRLYLHDRGRDGGSVVRWDDRARAWSPDPTPAYAERVAGKVLAVTSDAVTYDGRVLLKPSPGAHFGEHYYAGGRLFLKEAGPEATPPVNRLLACPWVPERDTAIRPDPALTVELTLKNEFMYAFGQWRDQVLAVSNNGRVVRLDGRGRATLREPVVTVSYQVYSILTYHDRLLLGHYPTGELFEYAGGDLKYLKGWPPVLPGVSPSAREAQTLAVYGGDLYAGVWPWGELWRYDRDRAAWAFVQRMFAHPLPTDGTVHPYEAETRRVDPVANHWGQRVTGLQPHGRSLVVTTSSKGGNPWEPKFAFLSEKQRAEYGATYAATQPGNLAAATEWKAGPTTFEVTLAGGELTVSQDGRVLGTAPAGGAGRPARVVWGEGVYGPLAGKPVARSWSGTR